MLRTPSPLPEEQFSQAEEDHQLTSHENITETADRPPVRKRQKVEKAEAAKGQRSNNRVNLQQSEAILSALLGVEKQKGSQAQRLYSLSVQIENLVHGLRSQLAENNRQGSVQLQQSMLFGWQSHNMLSTPTAASHDPVLDTMPSSLPSLSRKC